MIKRFAAISALGAMLLAGLPLVASAETTASSTEATSCVKTAVATRESALGADWTTFSAAVKAAYTARATALSAAYGKTSTKEVRTAVKTAWKAFKSSVQSARSAWKTTRGDAWKAFKSAAKACKNSADIEDGGNEGTDTSV